MNGESLLNRIQIVALEIIWARPVRSGFMHIGISLLNDASEADSLIRQAADVAELNQSQVEALLKKKVKALACPENIKAVHEVFSILAKWRDEAKAKKSSVVDDSNQITTTQNKNRNI